MMKRDDRLYVAGHTGLVGSAIVRKLAAEGFGKIVTAELDDLDLRDAGSVDAFFADARPRYVFLAAAKVGGIVANSTYPADFIRDNLMIQTNVIDAAHRYGAAKLLFLGSSCIYPKHAPQPMREEHLLSGHLEPTNEPYAVAKIAGIKMVQSYSRQFGFRGISLMPTNLYGPGDNFDLETSHVIPALMRKFHEAKQAGRGEVEVWGSGTPRREFLHVDDLADACLFLMQHYDDPEIVNVGCGEDQSIRELAELMGEVTGFPGEIAFDSTKPDGTPQKLLDVSRLTGLGWRYSIPLAEGLARTYRWYLEHRA